VVVEGGVLISRISREFRFARLWQWIEKSVTRRFAFAAVMGLAAAALHWAIFPITQARVTFIFFIPAIVLVTTLAGRWPGALVAIVGIVNSALMKAPGTLMIPNSAEQVALISSAIVSVLVILVGDYYRALSRRELSDLNELHELSAALASIPGLHDQLQLILATFVRIHQGDKGLISIYDPRRDRLNVSASIGFRARALETLRDSKGTLGAAGLACVDKARVIVEDVETDARVADFREISRADGVRALHSTPLVSRDGDILGALSVHFANPRRPTDREIRIADICARKASVFIERARAEDLVNQRDRRFQSVLEASGVPFLIFSPERDAAGKIVEFRWVFLNTAAAEIMRVKPGDFVGRRVTETLPRASICMWKR
jgi:GAF domain-containing protein